MSPVPLFFKAHVSGYVKKDGTVVHAHERHHPTGSAARVAKKLGGRLVASAINPHITAQRGLNIVGKSVSSAQELAEICQVFRNPSYETFRVFMARGSQIVGQMAVSARLPGTTPFPEGFEGEVMSQMERLKADKVWLLHNHPSGDPTPSGGDKDKTLQLAQGWRNVAGHIIINSGKFSYWTPVGGWRENQPLDVSPWSDWGDELHNFLTPDDALVLDNAPGVLLKPVGENVAKLARMVKRGEKADAVLVSVSKGRKIRALSTVSSSALYDPFTSPGMQDRWINDEVRERAYARVLTLMRLMAVQTGSNQGMVLFCDESKLPHVVWLWNAGLVVDVISVGDGGSLRSHVDTIGDMSPSGNQKHIGPYQKASKVVERFFEKQGYSA